MYTRTLAPKLKRLSEQYPVVSVTGPRQSGKTTLARMVFPRYRYVTLEDIEERDFATKDPKGFLARFGDGVILDEVQRAPDLFSYIQTRVDAERRPGQFVLTGSQQFLMLSKVGQTLAGRTALLRLLPFSLSELRNSRPVDPARYPLPIAERPPAPSLEKILFQGLYPRIYDQSLDAREWLASTEATILLIRGRKGSPEFDA